MNHDPIPTLTAHLFLMDLNYGDVCIKAGNYTSGLSSRGWCHGWSERL